MFISLLKHLRIIAPIEEEDSTTRYFMPCALAHVDTAQPSEQDQPSPVKPLLIKFDCGFIPIGAFGAIVAQLLQKKNNGRQRLDWKLVESKIFRDQVTIRLNRHAKIVIQEHASYFSVKLLSDTLALPERKKNLFQLCSKARRQLLHSIVKVGRVLEYMENCKATHCFMCPCPGESISHIATIEDEDGDQFLLCSQNEDKTFPLTDEYNVWLFEVR